MRFRSRHEYPDDASLIAALRAGDERAFAYLMDLYSASMLRVARGYVATKEAAEDVVQETWLGVIKGIDSFEGRSSLKTWIFRILMNRAQTRGERESRTSPFSSVAPRDDGGSDPDHFVERGWNRGFWAAPPSSREIPDENVVVQEAGEILMDAIEQLPDAQRIVITMRDVEGVDSADVCNLLGITEANQRVLLHRARIKVRRVFDRYLEGRPDT